MAWFVRVCSSFSATRGLTIEYSGFGVIHRIGITFVIAYIIYMMYANALYNERETGRSGMIVKVKGINRLDKLWDSADFVFPPQETHAFFITTFALRTRQLQGNCPDVADSTNNVKCRSNTDCVRDRLTKNGYQIAKCNRTTGTCFVRSWCPVEDRNKTTTERIVFSSIGHYTVLLKNMVKFVNFNKTISNIPNDFDPSCTYHPTTNPYCPIFNVSTMLDLANINYSKIVEKGAVLVVSVKWNCHFNLPYRPCMPQYSFASLEDQTDEKMKGYNYRYSIHDTYTGVRQRDLYKLYGVRCYIYVFADGQRFHFVTFLTNLGSLLVYLANVGVVLTLFIWILSTCACCDRKSQNCCAKFFHYTYDLEQKIDAVDPVQSPCCFKSYLSSASNRKYVNDVDLNGSDMEKIDIKKDQL